MCNYCSRVVSSQIVYCAICTHLHIVSFVTLMDHHIVVTILSLLILPHYQRTPLHIAARENYERTVECLVDKGAGINIKDKAGVSHTIDINMHILIATCI